MPANIKYLLKSGWAKASKVIAAILGGLLVTSILHILVALTWDAEFTTLSLWFTFPNTWVFLMAVVYWIKNPWRVWAMIMSLSLLGGVIIYYLKS